MPEGADLILSVDFTWVGYPAWAMSGRGCAAQVLFESAKDDFALLHEDTAGAVADTTTGEVVGGGAACGLSADTGHARGEVGGDGEDSERRTLVGTAVPEGEFAVAVVHLVGFVFVFVHVGVGGTAFAQVFGVGEAPNGRVALGNGADGLQRGKGATPFVVAHVGGSGEDVACAGGEVVDAKAFGVVAHEAPQVLLVLSIYCSCTEGDLRIFSTFNHIAFCTQLEGIPLRASSKILSINACHIETRIPFRNRFGSVVTSFHEATFDAHIAVHPYQGW